MLLLLQRWLKNGGYTGGPAVEVDLSVSTPDLRGTLVRFMNWYAAGRKGDPFQPAKAPVSLKGVHAALQELVKQACIAAGTELYHLRVQVSGTWFCCRQAAASAPACGWNAVRACMCRSNTMMLSDLSACPTCKSLQPLPRHGMQFSLRSCYEQHAVVSKPAVCLQVSRTCSVGCSGCCDCNHSITHCRCAICATTQC